MNTSKNKLIIIAGPTASGKTRLAIEVAKALNTEIVSFDSRQFYREISIGTAKPLKEELNEVPHHFIGHISIEQEYNAGQYEIDAIKKLDELFEKFDQVVFVGGSGMYLDAVLYGFDALPKVDNAIRENLENVLKRDGLQRLQLMLKELDLEYYHRVDLSNPQRVMRGLEVCLATGIPYSKQRKGTQKERIFTPVLYGIETDREVLYDRINQRVLKMIDEGLVDEARSVENLEHLNALQTVGYKELFDHFKGKTDLPTAIELIQQNTRRYAKRQITWFKRYEEMKWIKSDKFSDFIKTQDPNSK